MSAVVATIDIAAIWAALIALGGTILGGAFVMAWRLGGLSSNLENVEERIKENTARLDVIDAKASAAQTAATAATAAASAISSTLQRRRTDPGYRTDN